MLPSDLKVFLALGVTDLRKSIDGLSGLAIRTKKKELLTGSLFVFCNRRKNRIKILYWETNGFCLWLKRLEEHRFKWPKREEDVLEVTSRELEWLLAGLDLAQAHERLDYDYVT